MSRRQLAMGLWVATIAACVFSDGRGASAAVITWKGASVASFGLGTNWNGNVAPGTGDTAQFNANATPTVDTSPTTGALGLLNSSVTLTAGGGAARSYSVLGAATISGSTLALSAGTQSLFLQSSSVNLFSNAVLLVNASTQVATNTLSIASDTSNTSSATIDGSSAALAVSGLTSLSNAGGVASLTFSNNATGSFAALDIGGATSTGAGAHMTVASGARVIATGNVNVGTTAQGGANSILSVTGANSDFAQSGAVQLIVGTNSGSLTGRATLSLTSGGVYSTGTASPGTPVTTVFNTGTLNIGIGSNFNNHGDLLVDGGTVTRADAGNLNLDNNATFKVDHNGSATFSGFYAIGNGTTFQIESGGHFSVASFLDIGNGSAGTLVVDGAGSAVTASAEPYWGANGGVATVTIRNGGSATVNSLLWIAQDATAGTTSNVSVQSGGTLSIHDLYMATMGGNVSGSLVVTGTNSAVTQAGASTMVLGQGASSASVQVNSGATFTTGTGATTIYGGASLSIGGGIYNANGPIKLSGGGIAMTGGTLNLNAGSSLSIGSFPFSGAVNINNATLSSTGLLSLGSAATLTIAGSTNNWAGRLILDTPGIAVSEVVRTTSAADKTAKLSTLLNQILSGRNGGAWNGNGISSATAAASPNTLGLGLFDNAILGKTSFSGSAMTINSNDLLIALAPLGDANLDNQVNALDLNVIAAHWNLHNATNWAVGDLNSDGIVDSLDVGIVLSHWTGGPFAAQVNYAPNFSYTLVPVPEPGSVGVLAVGAGLLVRRRRRTSLGRLP